MLAIYYLVFTTKETSESDANMYMLIIFRASSIVFLGCVTSSDVVLSVRVIAKLRLVPTHNPVRLANVNHFLFAYDTSSLGKYPAQL